MSEEEIEDLKEKLEAAEEQLFLSQTDLQNERTQNIALKNFIQDLYESCEELSKSNEEEQASVPLDLKDVLKNLMKNIRKFSKDNNIRL